MPDTQEAIVITLDETPLDTVVAGAAAPAAAPAAKPSDDPKEGIEELRRQLASKNDEAARERNRADEAERRASEAGGEARQSRSNAERHAYDSIASTLAAREGELLAAKADYKAAMEAGEFDKAADLSATLGELGGDIRELRRGKSEMEERAKAPAAGTRDERPPPGDWSKPWSTAEADAYAASRTPATAAWIRANPKFATDVAFRHKVQAADAYATQLRGVARDTDEYFRIVEEQVGVRQGDTGAARAETAGDATSSAARTTERVGPAAAATPAPASRPAAAARPAGSVPGAGPSSATEIRLTREEYDAAPLLIPDAKTPQEARERYGMQKLALIREGKMTADGRVVNPH